MELDDLYPEIVLDHVRHPRGRAALRDDEVVADEENPLCGDRLRLALTVKDGRIEDIRHDGRGCAISTASASILCAYAKGRPVDEARRFADRFIAMLRGEAPVEGGEGEDWAALAGVREFPMRVRCATMAWHALKRALDKRAGVG